MKTTDVKNELSSAHEATLQAGDVEQPPYEVPGFVTYTDEAILKELGPAQTIGYMGTSPGGMP